MGAEGKKGFLRRKRRDTGDRLAEVIRGKIVRPAAGSVGRTAISLCALAALAITPVPASDFVLREGARLKLGGAPFSFVGANAYPLCMDAARGDTAKVREVMAMARDAGMTVLRAWAFNDSPDTLDPAVIQYRPGLLNEQALRGIDYVVATAVEYDLRLLFTLVNSWDDFGGMNRYAEWRAMDDAAAAARSPGGDVVPESPGSRYSPDQLAGTVTGPAGRSYRVAVDPSWGHDDFYTDSLIVSWFKSYLAAITTRTNLLTGVAYRDDPAILGWELANEPRSSDRTGGKVLAWVTEMSSYLKTLDSNHLVGTGEEGFDVRPSGYSTVQYGAGDWLFDGSMGVSFSANTSVPSVDFASVHFYPEYWGLPRGCGSGWIADHMELSRSMNRPLVVGEFGAVWDRAAAYDSWLNAAVGDGAAGALVWQLLAKGRTDAQGFGFSCPEEADVCGVLETYAGRFSARDSGGLGVPASIELYQNYPNPFNSTTLIPYDLPADADVTLDLWDTRGARVAVLFGGFQRAGPRLQYFDPGKLASGVYFYRLSAGLLVRTRKLTILR